MYLKSYEDVQMAIAFDFLELHYDLLWGIIRCLKEWKKK
jgi:hypothetical protein